MRFDQNKMVHLLRCHAPESCKFFLFWVIVGIFIAIFAKCTLIEQARLKSITWNFFGSFGIGLAIISFVLAIFEKHCQRIESNRLWCMLDGTILYASRNFLNVTIGFGAAVLPILVIHYSDLFFMGSSLVIFGFFLDLSVLLFMVLFVLFMRILIDDRTALITCFEKVSF